MSQGRAAAYLQIPAEYCRSFGGLRWAQYGEVVEFLEGPAAGRTFAFAAEIAVFLEGLVDSGGGLPGFGFVLHLLYLIGLGDRAIRHGEGGARCVECIAAPFQALGCPVRNAGALSAWLSREAPHAADPPELVDLHELLTGGSWVPQTILSQHLLGVMDQAEEPALDSSEFQEMVRREAESLSDSEIRHWLRHGRGPSHAHDERLAPTRPRGLAETLTELDRRPRLAGIGRLVSRLQGMLTLPPRRLAWSQLQDGGYADITTRGAPEQILPMQFAIEGEEFLRRFAERELLYFHREEPRQPATEEIIVLLDQGVRTWGEVRLVLTGSAIALVRQAERRQIAISLAATSNDGEAVDPGRLEPRALISLLEASDLSPHPGQALARLLEGPLAGRRDIVLLTHPRSLADPAVAAAARLLGEEGGARLFAITVDAQGRLELAAVRDGLPVVLARSRITVGDGESAVGLARAVPDGPARPPWKGSFESIGFPFQTALLDEFKGDWPPVFANFDFDESGDRILVVGRHGLLFSCRVDGSEAETLPRPRIDDGVVSFRRTVTGVAGGFVVEGTCGHNRLLAHYDFSARTVNLHEIDDPDGSWTWLYYRDLHAVAGVAARPDRPSVAIDLGETGPRATSSARANRAAERADAGIRPYPFTTSTQGNPSAVPRDEAIGQAIRLDSRSGTLRYHRRPAGERSLAPLVNGLPALKGGAIVGAIQGGEVVAVLVVKGAQPGLYFLSLSRTCVLGTFTLSDRADGIAFALSRDGQRFARALEGQGLEVRDVPGDHRPLLVTPRESLWIHFATLGRSCLLVREFDPAGPRQVRSTCLIRWDRGRLEVTFDDAASLLDQLGGPFAVSRSVATGNQGRGYDPDRFVQVVEGNGLRILIDRYNHLAIMDRVGALVCVFYVSGTEMAAWLPDGTMWGPRRLIGGEPAAGATERIAAAIARADVGEGRSS